MRALTVEKVAVEGEIKELLGIGAKKLAPAYLIEGQIQEASGRLAALQERIDAEEENPAPGVSEERITTILGLTHEIEDQLGTR